MFPGLRCDLLLPHQPANPVCTDWLTCSLLGMPLMWRTTGQCPRLSHSSQFPSSMHMHSIKLNLPQISAHVISSLGTFFSLKYPPPAMPPPNLMSSVTSEQRFIFQETAYMSPSVKPHLALSSRLILLQIVGRKQPGYLQFCSWTPAQALNTCLWNEHN